MRYCSEKTSLEMNPPTLLRRPIQTRNERKRGNDTQSRNKLQVIRDTRLPSPFLPIFYHHLQSCVQERSGRGADKKANSRFRLILCKHSCSFFFVFPSFLLQWPYCTRGDTSSLAEETHVVQLDLFTAQELSGDTQTPLPFSRKLLALLPFLGVSFWCIRHNKSRKHPFCPLFYRQKRRKKSFICHLKPICCMY